MSCVWLKQKANLCFKKFFLISRAFSIYIYIFEEVKTIFVYYMYLLTVKNEWINLTSEPNLAKFPRFCPTQKDADQFWSNVTKNTVLFGRMIFYWIIPREMTRFGGDVLLKSSLHFSKFKDFTDFLESRKILSVFNFVWAPKCHKILKHSI